MSAWIGSHGGDRHYEPPSSKASLDRIADALEAIAKTQRETVEILRYVHGAYVCLTCGCVNEQSDGECMPCTIGKANAARAKP